MVCGATGKRSFGWRSISTTKLEDCVIYSQSTKNIALSLLSPCSVALPGCSSIVALTVEVPEAFPVHLRLASRICVLKQISSREQPGRVLDNMGMGLRVRRME